MVKKRSAILCGHIERQAWSETWRAVTVLVCFRNEGFHGCGTLSATAMMVLGKLRWMVTPSRFSSVQFSLVAQSCPTLCNPMDRSTPGFLVHHQFLELAQTHVHWVGDATQPSHPVIPFSSRLQSFPASGSFQMSQFFASDNQSIGASASASVLPKNIQDWLPLRWTGVFKIMLLSSWGHSWRLWYLFWSSPLEVFSIPGAVAGNSLKVQRLRLSAFTVLAQVQPLVREPRSCKPHRINKWTNKQSKSWGYCDLMCLREEIPGKEQGRRN